MRTKQDENLKKEEQSRTQKFEKEDKIGHRKVTILLNVINA